MSTTDYQHWTKKKTSEIMRDLADLPGGDKIQLVQMLDYMRGRAFGMAIVLLAVLSLIPNVFGHVFVTGFLITILGGQMSLGLTRIYLPRRVLAISFSRTGIKKVMDIAAPRIAYIETLLKPRLIFMTESMGKRIIGLVIMPLSLLVLVPLPFSNMVPALAILVLALGMIEKDGLVVLIGVLVAISAVILVNETIRRLFGA